MLRSIHDTRTRVWKKLTDQTKRLGRQLTETVLKLYYSAQDDQTPAWARTVIYGALVYFLVPIDAIPDLLPTGYTDDLATLLAAVTTVSVHITPAHVSKAHTTADRWFKPNTGSTDTNQAQSQSSQSQSTQSKNSALENRQLKSTAGAD